MKKMMLIIAVAAVGLSMTSCQKTDYKAKGIELANRMNEMFQKQDTAGIIALNDTIRLVDEEVAATGDTAQVEAFRAAVKEVREKAAPLITVVKIGKGVTRKEAVEEVINDGLEGGVDIDAVTNSIDAAIKKDKENKKN